jgi:tRNA 2-thiouridine synthesizing protein E
MPEARTKAGIDTDRPGLPIIEPWTQPFLGKQSMRTRADEISEMIAGGRKVAIDEQGFLLDPEDWDEATASELARRAGITLTPLHWDVLHFMRAFLAENGVAADARFVFRFLDGHAGAGTKSGRELFFELFPYGYVGQACRIAGMRQPRAWSTG